MDCSDKSINHGRNIIYGFLRSIPFNTLLDIGAGKGEDISIAGIINAKPKKYAIEFDSKNESILKDKGVNVFNINIEKDLLPLENECIDVAIANQILEHTKELFWIFHEICRILKIGGHLIVGVPNLASFHNRLLLLLGKHPTCIKSCSSHIRGFTKSDLVKSTEISCLKLVDLRGSKLLSFSSHASKGFEQDAAVNERFYFFQFPKDVSLQR